MHFFSSLLIIVLPLIVILYQYFHICSCFYIPFLIYILILFQFLFVRGGHRVVGAGVVGREGREGVEMATKQRVLKS